MTSRRSHRARIIGRQISNSPARDRQAGGGDEAAEAALEIGAQNGVLRLEGVERVPELGAPGVTARPVQQAIEATEIERLALFGPIHHLVESPGRFVRGEIEHGARHRGHRDPFDHVLILGPQAGEVHDEVTLGPLPGSAR